MKKLDNEHKQQRSAQDIQHEHKDARQIIKTKILPNCAENYAEHVQWVKP